MDLSRDVLPDLQRRIVRKRKPSGLFQWFLKAPQWIFRLKPGFLTGDRFLLLTPTGRKSGTTFRTPLDVVSTTGTPASTSSVPGPDRQPTGG